MSGNHVPGRQHGVAPQHARPGPAHHQPDALTLGRFVAVHCAIGAGRLGLAKHATFQAPARIIVQFEAVTTQRGVPRAVMAAAIHPEHGGDGFELAPPSNELRLNCGVAARHGHDRSPFNIGIDNTTL